MGTNQSTLYIAVPGIGGEEQGTTVDDFAKSYAKVTQIPLLESHEELVLTEKKCEAIQSDDALPSREDIVTFTTPIYKANGSKNRTLYFSELFWGDLSSIKDSFLGVFKGFFKVIFGIRHLIPPLEEHKGVKPAAFMGRVFFSVLGGPILGYSICGYFSWIFATLVFTAAKLFYTDHSSDNPPQEIEQAAGAQAQLWMNEHAFGVFCFAILVLLGIVIWYRHKEHSKTFNNGTTEFLVYLCLSYILLFLTLPYFMEVPVSKLWLGLLLPITLFLIGLFLTQKDGAKHKNKPPIHFNLTYFALTLGLSMCALLLFKDSGQPLIPPGSDGPLVNVAFVNLFVIPAVNIWLFLIFVVFLNLLYNIPAWVRLEVATFKSNKGQSHPNGASDKKKQEKGYYPQSIVLCTLIPVFSIAFWIIVMPLLFLSTYALTPEYMRMEAYRDVMLLCVPTIGWMLFGFTVVGVFAVRETIIRQNTLNDRVEGANKRQYKFTQGKNMRVVISPALIRVLYITAILMSFLFLEIFAYKLFYLIHSGESSSDIAAFFLTSLPERLYYATDFLNNISIIAVTLILPIIGYNRSFVALILNTLIDVINYFRPEKDQAGLLWMGAYQKCNFEIRRKIRQRFTAIVQHFLSSRPNCDKHNVVIVAHSQGTVFALEFIKYQNWLIAISTLDKQLRMLLKKSTGDLAEKAIQLNDLIQELCDELSSKEVVTLNKLAQKWLDESPEFEEDDIDKQLQYLNDMLQKVRAERKEAPADEFIPVTIVDLLQRADMLVLDKLNSIKLVTMGSPYTSIYHYYFPELCFNESHFFHVFDRQKQQTNGSLKSKYWINLYRTDDFVGTYLTLDKNDVYTLNNGTKCPSSITFPKNREVGPGGHTGYFHDKRIIPSICKFARELDCEEIRDWQACREGPMPRIMVN